MDYRIEEYINNRHLCYDYINNKCKIFDNTISIPLYTFDWIHWEQERYITPVNWVKSKTKYWSTGVYFLNWWNREKDILIVEWEIDFLSIIPYATDYNILWLKWVNNLTRAIKDIEQLQKVYDVYILVDNDMPAEESIVRVPYTPLHLYDVRWALSWCKDVNEAICSWKLNMNILPKRITKLKPIEKKRQSFRNSEIDLFWINNISAIDVLESLFPEYRRKWIEAIAENWKETHWYKYSKTLNIVKDFSGKGRPWGTTFQIAKAKFWDARLVFEYFKWKY